MQETMHQSNSKGKNMHVSYLYYRMFLSGKILLCLQNFEHNRQLKASIASIMLGSV